MGTGYGLAQQINNIFQKYHLKCLKIIRLGPRFFIVLCQKKQQKCLLKINLNERKINQDCRTYNEHLAREIFFLQYLNKQNQYPFIKKSIPRVLAADPLNERVWYLKSYYQGKLQNLHQSNFLFKGSFFNQVNLNWLIKFFSELHQFSKTAPKNFQKIFHRHQLKDYLNLINGQRIKKIIGNKLSKIYTFLKQNEKIFNQSQKALTHFEPYPVHFLKKNDGFIIIDWENIGWGNSAHDLGVIWLRAYQNKSWRDYLAQKFVQTTPLNKYWWPLFKTEIIVQSLANLPYFQDTTNPDEKKRAPKIIQFMKEQIDLIITNKFPNGKLY